MIIPKYHPKATLEVATIQCKITPTEDGTFHFGGDVDAVGLIVRDRQGLPEDFVAWERDRLGKWWLREGRSVILGASQLAGAELGTGQLPIYPHPQSWVDAGGDGVCVLDWDANLLWLLEGLDLDLTHLPPPMSQQLALKLKANFEAYEPEVMV